jgi:hypothetical protein
MSEYGVVQLGEYLVSVPGALLYSVGAYLAIGLAWALSDYRDTKHFKFTKFAVFGTLFVSIMTLLWIALGVWFYVKA